MAGLTTTQAFIDGDTVTAAKLNNIVGGASINDDAITTLKIDDGAVTLLKMDALSVDTGQLAERHGGQDGQSQRDECVCQPDRCSNCYKSTLGGNE